jgi:hypothetical protein
MDLLLGIQNAGSATDPTARDVEKMSTNADSAA